MNEHKDLLFIHFKKNLLIQISNILLMFVFFYGWTVDNCYTTIKNILRGGLFNRNRSCCENDVLRRWKKDPHFNKISVMYIKLRILQGSCKIFCARSYPNQKWAENIHEEYWNIWNMEILNLRGLEKNKWEKKHYLICKFNFLYVTACLLI